MTPAQLDEVASSMERRWGINRLPLLVSQATAAKFKAAADALDTFNDHGALPGWAASADALRAVVARGWQVMDAEATAAGAEPLGDAFAEAEWAPGRYFAIARDDAHKQALVLRVKAEKRDVCIFSVQEVGQLVASIPDVARICELFPGAYVTTPPAPTRGGKRKMEVVDEIPFGGEDAA